ncbi:MAG TPA: HAMP domain-containing sensor histidine kinase [Hymenobacter sp.]|uniref:sensor histidine kinase n=1 Tax=Hymenobacter sp. TaxID=1898978 RepID=UPI002D80DCAF|nr:HAMP domain-containing sensor histidine kinase [Hymenobacter sp.]HET9505821.1 HAMP domain-containing sensor histidine kinase [Hymenobacter sp.]
MKALRGLRGQLALAFAVVFGLVVGLAGFYQYRQVGRVLHQGNELRLRARAEALLGRVEVSGAVPVVPLPVRGEQMRVVVEATGQPARELFHSPGFGMLAAEKETDTLSVVEVQQAATDYAGRSVQVRLWLAHSAAPLLADLGRVRLGLWGALAGSLALAAALAAGLGWLVLRPLRRISRQARRIGAAPGPERLPVPATGDEVQELAQALNKMLDRLQAGAELQDNFLAAAAHELRTPLAVLQTGLAVTRQSPELPANLRPALAAQSQELQRLGRLVEDFLLVSRLRSDALPLTRRPVPLDELVLAAADQLGPRFRAAGRPLDLSIDEAVPDYTVPGDADKLTTVIINLLDNALRHAPPGAAVHVAVGREAATGLFYAEVSNPIHTSLGDLSRLTTARYQADVLSGGAGLGLWLSNRIAELHGAPLALREADGRLYVRLRLQ